MAKDNSKKTIVNDKYLTLVFKYKEKEEQDSIYVFGNALRLLNTISNAVMTYNAKETNYGYSRFELTGFYVDPDDMSVEEQNEQYNEIVKQKLNKLK